MSSTYSTDLRLELIGTGDQAGVWGSTTNNTLGTLMEAAIAGYTSVSIIASPQALTALDGAPDQSRFNSIALTTTTGANFTVCVPPTPKLYTFYNASAYTATVTNATAKNGITPTGGTTIAIPAGKTVSVWTDGTNITQKSNYLVSPTLDAPTITGVSAAPTASFGNSTTQLATTAFVQAALQALHPVGSIYTSTSSTNPSTSFGFGTWVAFGAGRVMIGNGGGFTAGSTGGSADAIVVDHNHSASSTFTGSALGTHTHSGNTDTGGTHTHTYKTYGLGNNGLSGNANTNSDWGYAQTGNPPNTAEGSHNHSFTTGGTSAGTPSGSVSTSVSNAGSSATNANLQPYVVVYMWNRTA